MNVRLVGMICAGAMLLAASLAGAQPRIGGGGGGGGGGIGGGGGGGGGATPAPSGIIQGVPQAMEPLLALFKQAEGWEQATAGALDNGLKFIRTEQNKVTVVAVPDFCKDGLCKALMFMAFLGKHQVDAKWINAYNTTTSFTKLLQNADGTLVLRMDIHFVGGTSTDYITGSASVFTLRHKEVYEFEPK